MAASVPTPTKKPIKQYLAQVRFKMNDGSYLEVQPDATKRSIIIGVLNQIASLYTGSFPSGLEVEKIEIDLGNQLDTVKS